MTYQVEVVMPDVTVTLEVEAESVDEACDKAYDYIEELKVTEEVS